MTDKQHSDRSERAVFLPPQGGNIVLLTQQHWPTVHPALQESRPASDEEQAR